jgi:thymidylate kinase
MRTVALEGPCCAGKSTCIDLLFKQFGILTVPEFMDIAHDVPPFPPRSSRDISEAMEYFVHLEKVRVGLWSRLCEDLDRKGVVALDRSFLSVVGFQEAIRPLLGLGITFDARAFWGEQENLILPDYVVVLTARYELLIRRSLNAQGDYLPILLDRGFNKRFVESVVHQCQDRGIRCEVIDTSKRTPVEVLSLVRTKLSL